MKKICLVCSSGGHLFQLFLLKKFWINKNRFWVSFPTTDAKHILKAEKVQWAYFPTNRNVKNLFKNIYLANKLIRKERPSMLISTGAGIAVPFIIIAKFYKVKTIYIESITRNEELSLSGNLVLPFANKFFVQWENLSKKFNKTEYHGRSNMIFVILGTERYQFNRLIIAIDNLIENGDIKDEVFIQSGSCTYRPKNCNYQNFLSFDIMRNKIDSADLIIAHGGAGTTLLCIQRGHKPILVPRQKKYGEHVDDHQVSFCKMMKKTKLISVVYHTDILLETINSSQKIELKSNDLKIMDTKNKLIQ